MPWRACPDLCGGSPAMGIPTAITATEAVRRPHQQRHAAGQQPVAAELRFVRLRADAPAASAGAHRHCLRQDPVHHDPAEVAEYRCAGEDRREKGLVVVLRVVPPMRGPSLGPRPTCKNIRRGGRRGNFRVPSALHRTARRQRRRRTALARRPGSQNRLCKPRYALSGQHRDTIHDAGGTWVRTKPFHQWQNDSISAIGDECGLRRGSFG